MRKPRLLTPGPTPVLPEAALALAGPHPHHRTEEFRGVVRRLRERLREVFQTRGEILLLTSSGTGAMEAALGSLTRPGDTLLVVDSGKFGRRWLEIGAALGRRCVPIAVPPRRALAPEGLAAALAGEPGAVALCLAACESSTGVRVDLEALARTARAAAGNRLLLLVDAITELGAGPVRTDAWDLDVVIGGSQKAFMVPPGLAFLSLSERAVARLAPGGGFYFDLTRELAAQREGSTAWTPAIALFAALDVAVGRLLETGMEAIWHATDRRARMTRAAAGAMGLEVWPLDPAVSLTALSAPAGIDSGRIVAEVERSWGVRLAGGQGDLKGRIVRVAHLGWIDEVETLGALGALGLALGRLGHRADTAAGLAAALAVMAEPR